MHGKAIEYELLINLCLFSIKKKKQMEKKKIQQWKNNLSYYLYNVVDNAK